MNDMVTVEVSTLEGPALDWAVATCEGGIYEGPSVRATFWVWPGDPMKYSKEAPHYSTEWAQAGPIIDREKINLSAPFTRDNEDGYTMTRRDDWGASIDDVASQTGPTSLIAAMRCYVTSRFGNVMKIPAELAPAPSTERRARP